LGASLSRLDEARSHHEKIIPKYGSGFLVTRGDAFTTLARAIVGQQISVAAAQAVWDRVLVASKKKMNPKISWPYQLKNCVLQDYQGARLNTFEI